MLEVGTGAGGPRLDLGVTGGPIPVMVVFMPPPTKLLTLPAPPPPTKLSSSASALATEGRVAVMPKLSATLKLVAPPANRGLLGGFFAILLTNSIQL